MSRNRSQELPDNSNSPRRNAGCSHELSNRREANFAIKPFPENFDFQDGKRTVLRLNPVRVS